ncbi:hypothetical protein ACIQPR_46000 [Streptomyces sp. NPDC091280]|uniref:hypothetical protein n=1 Tax=Streptomyces sp. NPDC091280 TaxID=3365984 RepID=UPI003814955A
MQSHWGYRLGVLHTALGQLDTLNQEWLRTRDALPAGATPGTPAFDNALAEHHAACWSHLDDWATHGHIIGDINFAARHAPSPLAPPPRATPTAAAGRTVEVRR